MSGESGILLCEGTGFMSRVIQVVSRGPVSHVAILHDGKVLESVPPGGVRVVDFDWWLEDRRDKRIWFRPFAQLMTDEMWNAGVEKYVGRPYAYRKALRLGLRMALGLHRRPLAIPSDTAPSDFLPDSADVGNYSA